MSSSLSTTTLRDAVLDAGAAEDEDGCRTGCDDVEAPVAGGVDFAATEGGVTGLAASFAFSTER